jgi:hypothetical protein
MSGILVDSDTAVPTATSRTLLAMNRIGFHFRAIYCIQRIKHRLSTRHRSGFQRGAESKSWKLCKHRKKHKLEATKQLDKVYAHLPHKLLLSWRAAIWSAMLHPPSMHDVAAELNASLLQTQALLWLTGVTRLSQR